MHYSCSAGFEWASEAVLRWLAAQGIEPFEVIQVLYSPGRQPRPGRHPELGQVLTIWGRTRAGRGLIVILAPTSTRLDWRIVNAGEMTAAQYEQYMQEKEQR